MGAMLGLAMLLALEVPSGESLRWSTPATGCPDAASVQRRLRGLVGDRSLDAQAEARVDAVGGRWRAELTVHWDDHSDRRSLEADDCASLAEATALLVAVMADPLTATARLDAPAPAGRPARPKDTPRSSVPRSPTRPPVRSARPSTPAPSPAPALPKGTPPPRMRGPTLGVALLLDAGTLPRITPGPLLTATWRASWVRLLVEGYLLPPRRVRSDDPSAQGQILMGAARAGACVRLAPAPRALMPLCAAAELGGARAQGFGLDGAEGALDLWLAATTRLQLVVPLGRTFALTAGAEMTMPVRRIDYRVRGERLHRTADVALRGLVGIEVGRFFSSNEPPQSRPAGE